MKSPSSCTEQTRQKTSSDGIEFYHAQKANAPQPFGGGCIIVECCCWEDEFFGRQARFCSGVTAAAAVAAAADAASVMLLVFVALLLLMIFLSRKATCFFHCRSSIIRVINYSSNSVVK
jgi:tetrahydromethanopterin S-methyltransferase subunit F